MKSSPAHDQPCESPRDLYTVTEISEAVRQHLESEFPRVHVIGEIANLKLHSSGHIYFTLRDSTSSIHAVLFRRSAERIACSPESGLLVIASGRISHFGGSGQTQLITTDLIPAGRGNLELEFRRLLKRLRDEGLTSPERKRTLPPYPLKIAVITSPTGAVLHDVVDTLRRRWPVAEIVHIPTDVQGLGAAQAIVRSFEMANRADDIDVVILARGGGSVEDLWPFNREEVARAVAGSAHPVITGIGHEIDTTVADYVADVRAATPTAAAELSAPSIDEVTRSLEEVLEGISLRAEASLENRSHLVEYVLRSGAFAAIAHRMERAEVGADHALQALCGLWEERCDAWDRNIDRCVEGMAHAAGVFRERVAATLDSLIVRLQGRNPLEEVRASSRTIDHLARVARIALSGVVAVRRKEVGGKMSALDALDPRGVLRRGFTVCTSGDDERIIPRIEALGTRTDLTVHFHDGAARCDVRNKRKGTPWRKRPALKKPSSGSTRS